MGRQGSPHQVLAGVCTLSPARPRPEAPLNLAIDGNTGLMGTRGTQQRSRTFGGPGDSRQIDRQLDRYLDRQPGVGVQAQEGGS